MADDRMAIVCNMCKLGMAIAKFWHSRGWTSVSPSKERSEAFFAKHTGCGEEGYGYRHYYLGYEMDGSDWVYDNVMLDKHNG